MLMDRSDREVNPLVMAQMIAQSLANALRDGRKIRTVGVRTMTRLLETYRTGYLYVGTASGFSECIDEQDSTFTEEGANVNHLRAALDATRKILGEQEVAPDQFVEQKRTALTSLLTPNIDEHALAFIDAFLKAVEQEHKLST